jgi:hypothetical protein
MVSTGLMALAATSGEAAGEEEWVRVGMMGVTVGVQQNLGWLFQKHWASENLEFEDEG